MMAVVAAQVEAVVEAGVAVPEDVGEAEARVAEAVVETGHRRKAVVYFAKAIIG